MTTEPVTTSNVESKGARFGKALLRRMAEVRERGNIRAILRKGNDDIYDLTVNPYVYRSFPTDMLGDGSPSPDELAFRDALCMYASKVRGSRDPHSGSVDNIGVTLQLVAKSRGKRPSEDTRVMRLHNSLVRAESREELVRAINGAVDAAIGAGVSVNFVKLAHDLRKYYWSYTGGTEVVTRWSHSYSRVKSVDE